MKNNSNIEISRPQVAKKFLAQADRACFGGL